MAWPTQFARPKPGLNHVLAYGQSLSSGWEGWPALSTAPLGGALMLGGSVRPGSESGEVWESVGGARLNPLVATVQDLATGALLGPAEVAALPEGALALGETVLEGAIAEWLHRFAGPADHRVLASACGVGGRSLESLSKGALPELFNRLRSCVRLARGLAGTEHLDYGILALLFLQGEHNSWGLGGTADRHVYKALLARFYADFVADIAAATSGQAMPPAMFLYQTGGAYASEDNAIAQAQLELALEMPPLFLVAPVYPVTDKGGHLDGNGYRWLGAQFGKVMHRVLCLGDPWRPLHPLNARWHGGAVRVTFHVPAPPLAWGRPFATVTRRDVADRGFSVVGPSQPAVPITEVSLDGADAVRITLAHPPAPGAMLRYAAARHGGLGCLHDSDASVAATHYQLERGDGAAPNADIAELAGQPYPLHNWCAAFSIPIEIG